MVTLYKLCDDIYRVIINIIYIIVKKISVIIEFLVMENLTNNNNNGK